MKDDHKIIYILFIAYAVIECLSLISLGIINHVVFILWLIAFISSEYNGVLQRPLYRYLFIFICYYFISSLIGASLSIAFNRTIAMLELFSPIFMFQYVNSKDNYKLSYIAVLGVVLIVDIIAAFSIINTVSDVGLRSTTSSYNESHEFILRNVFSLVYVSSILPAIMISFYKRLNKFKSLKTSLLLIILSVFFALFVFKALFMTAVLVMILSSIMALFSNTNRAFLKALLVIGTSYFLFLALYDSLINFILSNVENSHFYIVKLEEINNALTNNIHNAEDASSRMDLLYSSFNAFINHPLVGVNSQIFSMNDAQKLGVGYHSEWFDLLALYGIFALLLYKFIYGSIKYQYNITKQYLPLLLFIVIGFFNPVLSFMMNLFVFYVIPLSYKFLFKFK